MHVLGMLVQIIPSLSNPLIMKLSGGVLVSSPDLLTIRIRAGTTGLRTGLKVVVRSLETSSY